jgi:hypothetical protein
MMGTFSSAWDILSLFSDIIYIILYEREEFNLSEMIIKFIILISTFYILNRILGSERKYNLFKIT